MLLYKGAFKRNIQLKFLQNFMQNFFEKKFCMQLFQKKSSPPLIFNKKIKVF